MQASTSDGSAIEGTTMKRMRGATILRFSGTLTFPSDTTRCSRDPIHDQAATRSSRATRRFDVDLSSPVTQTCCQARAQARRTCREKWTIKDDGDAAVAPTIPDKSVAVKGTRGLPTIVFSGDAGWTAAPDDIYVPHDSRLRRQR